MTIVERELLAIALYESFARYELIDTPDAETESWIDIDQEQRNRWRDVAETIRDEARTKSIKP